MPFSVIVYVVLGSPVFFLSCVFINSFFESGCILFFMK